MATFNSSGWPQMQDFLQRSRAPVVTGQELHLFGGMRILAEEWCRKRGWQAFISDGTQTTHQRPTGGVGIFIRSHISAVPLTASAKSH
eukprot:6454671-Pyramimonas_sp.AAC.1